MATASASAASAFAPVPGNNTLIIAATCVSYAVIATALFALVRLAL